MKLKSFCTAKETMGPNKKTTLRVGENIYKWNSWQEINLQNIQTPHEIQYKNNQITQSKIGWKIQTDISPKKTDVQKVHKKILSLTNY